MSSRPSAFDILMSTARPTVKKKTLSQPSTSSSLEKNPSPTQTLNLASQMFKLHKPHASTVEAVEVRRNCVKFSEAEENSELKRKIGLLSKHSREFDPKMVSTWEDGESIPFLFLCLAFELISNKSGRKDMKNIACNMLRTIIDTTPQDLLACVYLAAGKVGPADEGLELGIGVTSIIKALSEAFDTPKAKLDRLHLVYEGLGDLGLVAKACRSSQSMMCKPDPLTIAKVFDTFQQIAKEAGKDSQEKKKNHIKALLVAAVDCERLYLVRLLQKKLNIGSSELTVLAALGQAAVYNKEHSTPPPDTRLEEAEEIVKQVYSVVPFFDKIIPALLSDGVWNLQNACGFRPGVPVKPMLAEQVKKLASILEKFQDKAFTCEYKYDGERAQIHYMEDGLVEIYSRKNERSTEKFPDVVLVVSRLKKPSVKSFVLDCELVAFDRNKRKSFPQQILNTRHRKNVTIDNIKVGVCIFAFDMLYLNGQELLQKNLKARREKLYDSFEEDPGYFQFATAMTSSNIDEIELFFNAAVESSCEGLIIKTLDGTYERSKRSHNWLKLKKDYIDGLGDSLDLVPIAAFHGQGKRRGVYGSFLVACYDSDKGEFQSISKIGTGFEEALLEELSANLFSNVIPTPKSYYRYDAKDTKPDVWFEPTEVWEVKAADLTISPVYCAAFGVIHPNKGISLRCPRFLLIRTDKNPEDATTSDQIAEMYKAQMNISQHRGANEDEDDSAR